MKAYAGIDLHSSNNYLGVIDNNARKLYGKRLSNKLDKVLKALKPIKKSLAGIAVESTFNWYWLVDGLIENGYNVRLANPSAIKQYEGIKHTDDKWDAFWLAQMLRLNILPEGYIYPKQERPIRDLLRRRQLFVRHRTSHILSLQGMISRHVGMRLSGREIKKLTIEDVEQIFDSPYLVLAALNNIDTIRFLSRKIRLIEREIKLEVQLKPEFECLLTVPGIGIILALTIMLEVGDIRRFPKVGNYSSYCRCVKSQRLSDNKKKGEGNRKNGNKYLAWAYVEAAHFAIRACKKAHSFYQRKKSKTNGAVATKALSNKLARASYYIMRDQRAFDQNMLFG